MDLEQRLARLERTNRRMKRIGALVLVVAAAVLLSGAAQGKDLPHLEVGSLTLKDKAGKMRASLRARADGPVWLALFDKDEKTRARLFAAADGRPRLALLGKAGERQATLTVFADGSPGLLLHDKDGKPRATLTVVADGSPSLALFDKDGNQRATLGVTGTVHKRTGAETKTSAGTLTLFDAKGDVLWQAPR